MGIRVSENHSQIVSDAAILAPEFSRKSLGLNDWPLNCAFGEGVALPGEPDGDALGGKANKTEKSPSSMTRGMLHFSGAPANINGATVIAPRP